MHIEMCILIPPQIKNIYINLVIHEHKCGRAIYTAMGNYMYLYIEEAKLR